MDEGGARADYRKDPTVYSSTPLEEASQWGHASAVAVLLARPGSDPRSESGRKARIAAERAGHACVAELLDAWEDRWNDLEEASLPAGFLPLALSRSTTPETRYAILRNHAGNLSGRRRRRSVPEDGFNTALLSNGASTT